MPASGLAAICAVWLACLAPARGDVLSSSPGGFHVRLRETVHASPLRAYQALRDVGHWWSSEHSFSGNALNLTLELRPGGCFCEIFPGGGGAEHLRVVLAQPGRRVVLHGTLGPLQNQGLAGALSFTFTPSAHGGTAIALDYVVGGYFIESHVDWPHAVDHMLGDTLHRLAVYIDGTAAGTSSILK